MNFSYEQDWGFFPAAEMNIQNEELIGHYEKLALLICL